MSTEAPALPHIIVIGGGVAGMTCALDLVESGRAHVTLIVKDALGQANTVMAQSGFAASWHPEDSPASHAEDTVRSGGGLSIPDSAREVTSRAVRALIRLQDRGVVWDRSAEDPEGSDLSGLEQRRVGAHSFPRSAHAGGDGVGKTIEFALRDRIVEAARKSEDPDAPEPLLSIREKTMVSDLIVENGRVTGAHLLGGEDLAADAVVIAVGGAGQMFSVTTNLRGATGDGAALALRAGAVIREPEMFQFHPTSLDVPGYPLLGEAVRGGGAHMIDEKGERFLTSYDERAELAPRDVVARAMYRHAQETGSKLFIDARPVGSPEELSASFPGLTRKLASKRLSWEDPIPVTPSAHYWMGGIASRVDGRTSLPGLFAVGESASTGMHGANRLATNSLVEGAVTGGACAALIAENAEQIARGELPEPWSDPAVEPMTLELQAGDDPTAPTPEDDVEEPPSRADLQRLMWECAGVVRTGASLQHAQTTLRYWLHQIEALPERGRPEEEMRSLLTSAILLVTGALAREETRGAHAREDFPDTEEQARSRGWTLRG